jgi:hypothetical protein
MYQADTVRVRQVERAPPVGGLDALHHGPPTLRLGWGAAVWLLRHADTVMLHAWIPDGTRSWNDELVVSLDLAGDATPLPEHDDFQWEFRRTLDSSVISRGRAGRWEAPRGDPDWRLGREHSGGGWSVAATERAEGWWLLLRLEGPWLSGREGKLPRLAVRVRDEASGRWAAWPPPARGLHASAVERSPALWVPASR